jgi:aryl-alcohol dehydrogenase-like predicted oxidoreductase
MIQSLNASLKRLNTDYIDLYWAYAWDPTTSVELLPMANNLDLGVTSWSPLGGGVLTGKYNRNGSSKTHPQREQ